MMTVLNFQKLCSNEEAIVIVICAIQHGLLNHLIAKLWFFIVVPYKLQHLRDSRLQGFFL